MKIVVPVTLAIILVLLYLTFRRWDEALLIMASLPFALTGGLWLLYLLGYNQSVASAVGFIALAGVAAELRSTAGDGRRSEEHTSELQSLMRISYAVFCLKTKNKEHNTKTNILI